MLAAFAGDLALCEALVALDADVNKPGWTPLHYAATNAHIAVMQYLLDQFAYVDATSPNGTTPLMMAAMYGNSSAVKLLLEAGADPGLKNDKGLGALEFAQQVKKEESSAIIAAFIRARRSERCLVATLYDVYYVKLHRKSISGFRIGQSEPLESENEAPRAN